MGAAVCEPSTTQGSIPVQHGVYVCVCVCGVCGVVCIHVCCMCVCVYVHVCLLCVCVCVDVFVCVCVYSICTCVLLVSNWNLIVLLQILQMSQHWEVDLTMLSIHISIGT